MHTTCTHTPAHTDIYAQTQKQTHMQHNNTENNAQNSTTQHITENNNTPAQPQQNSAHNYRTYSLDYYFEFAYIKNSNTIELYTILHDEV